MNIIQINRLKGMGSRLSGNIADEKSAEALRHAIDKLDIIVPHYEDNLLYFWIKEKRPTFKEYLRMTHQLTDYNEADEDVKNDISEEYKSEFPYDEVWLECATKHFQYRDGTSFYCFFLDGYVMLETGKTNNNSAYNALDLVKWLDIRIDRTIQMVENGTYETEILNKIPYRCLVGKMKRKDLWQILPDEKQNLLNLYHLDTVESFRGIFANGCNNIKQYRQISARAFYEACATVYKALSVRRERRSYQFIESPEEQQRYGASIDVLTPKEQYYAIADGRDDGLSKVPLDDCEAFEEWRQRKGPYYDFNGSHPFEIIPSMSISNSMHLYVRKMENGMFRFVLSGEASFRAPDTIRAAVALNDAGYPVEVVGYDTMLERIDGEDEVSIETSEYGFLSDSIVSLEETDKADKIICAAKWNRDEYRLKLKSE